MLETSLISTNSLIFPSAILVLSLCYFRHYALGSRACERDGRDTNL